MSPRAQKARPPPAEPVAAEASASTCPPHRWDIDDPKIWRCLKCPATKAPVEPRARTPWRNHVNAH